MRKPLWLPHFFWSGAQGHLRHALAVPARIIEDDKPLFTLTVQGNH
jgi:hypothetical protein